MCELEVESILGDGVTVIKETNIEVFQRYVSCYSYNVRVTLIIR